MNLLDEYSAWTDDFAVYPKTAEPHYLALGICEELGELSRAALIDDVILEAGDVLWYAARYSRLVLGTPFSAFARSDAFASVDHTPLTSLEAAAIIAGVEKKRLRDGANWDAKKRLEKNAAASEALQIIIKHTIEMAWRRAGATITVLLTKNKAKLTARRAADTLHGDGDHR